MELEGHPTQDIVEELQRRGALAYPGTDKGPDQQSMGLAIRRHEERNGMWLFLAKEAYDTEIDESPPFL